VQLKFDLLRVRNTRLLKADRELETEPTLPKTRATIIKIANSNLSNYLNLQYFLQLAKTWNLIRHPFLACFPPIT
jgi:hypothetical protein